MRVLPAILIILAFFSACGRDRHQRIELASLIDGYATIAQSAISMLGSEFGNASAPPAPGALANSGCMRKRCDRDPENDYGFSAVFYKQAWGCRTDFGARDGTIFFAIDGIEEFAGCATRQGPFTFSSWPPKSGSIRVSVGQLSLLSSGVSESHPSNTLDRVESGRRIIRHWGTSSLAFDGSARARVSVDHWAQIVNPIEGDPDAARYHFHSSNGLTMHLATPWDSDPRILSGTLNMTDQARRIHSEVHLDNLIFRKDLCCHPVGGTLTVSSSLTADNASGEASTYQIIFGSICGKVRLRDELGFSRETSLPDCAG